MLPWTERARARAPGGEDLVLCERAGEFVIRVGGRVLMESRAHGSEEALAEQACGAIADREAARVLVGGLGFGFTLRAALGALPAGAQVVVAEVVPAVVEWSRGIVADLAGRPLEDARVEVHVGDVGAYLGSPPTRFDAILLDVDNGPQALTRRGNQGLYTLAGLTTARRALRPGGVLALWSAARHPDFERRLASAGFAVEVARSAPGGRRLRHTIYLARNPAPRLGGR